jgi:predicted nucleic acid-binding protein
VFSDLTLNEIKKHCFYDKEDVIELLTAFEIQFEFVKLTDRDKELSKKFFAKGVHAPDCIHAAFAMNCGCEILVTFNKKDFLALEGLILVLSPNELVG